MTRSAIERELERALPGGAAALAWVAEAHESDPAAHGRLVGVAARRPDDPIAAAATWVMLALVKQGALTGLTGRVIERISRLLELTTQWAARLHVLQMLGRPEVFKRLERGARNALGATTLGLASDRNAFVRAWAVNLLGMLGPQLRGGARAKAAAAISAADASGPACVRARLRRVRAAGGLAWMEGGARGGQTSIGAGGRRRPR